MIHPLIEEVTQDQLQEGRDQFKVGDAVRVHIKVREGEKERIQIFEGIVINKHGSRHQATFTVRRMSFGSGVEKIFPVHSPVIAKIEVTKESIVTRRKRLFYMRGFVGKSFKVTEKRIADAAKAARNKKKEVKA